MKNLEQRHVVNTRLGGNIAERSAFHRIVEIEDELSGYLRRRIR
ncbi:hypothetical protein P9139_04190 [Curtobacterium flaccumfaciens]|nr:hypothetical protein P9139_04190 [Curtobacterium flaccumfaciens]